MSAGEIEGFSENLSASGHYFITMQLQVPTELIEQRIYLIRGQKVMLDRDLAELYQVQTKNLNKAVKRNIDRFPEDFMFRVAPEEIESLRFQFGTSNPGRGGRRYLPYVFSEKGVAMLSSVLNSQRAVQMNIAIVRVFRDESKAWSTSIKTMIKKSGQSSTPFASLFPRLRHPSVKSGSPAAIFELHFSYGYRRPNV
jgi:hypothetical protein